MDNTYPATVAGLRFSELLKVVKQGRSVIITSHGKPVARVVPYVGDTRTAEVARSALFARLKAERITKIGLWSRAELYERAP